MASGPAGLSGGGALLDADTKALLETLVHRHDSLVAKRSDPVNMETMKHQAVTKLNQEIADLSRVVQASQALQQAEDEVASILEMLNDDDKDIVEMAEAEMETAAAVVTHAHKELLSAMVPKEPIDVGNAILEIRAGSGGLESALFGGELLQSYELYLKTLPLRFKVIDSSSNDLGGIRQVTANIVGENAYGIMKFESGTHRVQRIPSTEAKGRVHTSTVFVAVLPEPSEVDLPEINEGDIKVDTFRASGAGGQHVNTTDSAVRLTHIPTGIVCECQSQRSQFKNKDQAMKILRARIYAKIVADEEQERRELHEQLIGSVDQTGRMRTYNFQQDRVTDHRCGIDSTIGSFTAGECFSEFYEHLKEDHDTRRLAEAVSIMSAEGE